MEDELADAEADAFSAMASVNIDLENSDVLPDETFVDDEELKEESLDTISAITHADESVYTQGTSLGYKKYTDLHIHIQSKLRQSRLLQPEWIEVTNVSYQYAMRKTLRPKRRMAVITKLHASNGLWESYIWKMKRREEDYEIVPQKHFLSTHKSRWAAYRHADTACVERDANPAEVKSTAPTIDQKAILSTHYKILIVSSSFDRLSHIQRLELIYQEFCNLFGMNLHPRGAAGVETYSAPYKFKLATYIGKNVCSLDPLRFVIFDNVTLIIEAKTPSQWRPNEFEAPDSERFGTSHFDMQSLNLPSYSLAPSQKKRVKQLAVDLKNDPNVRMMQLQGISTSSKNSSKSYVQFTPDHLGVDPSVSGVYVSAKKKGGVYGHFFHGLSPTIKELIMGRYILNKKLIQEEGVKKKPVSKAQAAAIDTFQPKTSMSMLRKKIEKAANESEYDKGTSSESEMIDEVFIYAKTIDRWVVPLQRLWRIRAFKIAARTIWRRNYAVLIMQRSIRALYARRYVRLLRKLYPIAASRIQKCYRALRTRRRIAVWQKLSYYLTRKVLPKIKLFLKRCFESWIAKRKVSATKIQSVIAMYCAKLRRLQMEGERHFLPLPHMAAVKIQKIMRGRWGRESLAPRLEEMLKRKVDIPSATCIQRIMRAKIGRRIALRKRIERDAANVIQRRVQYFLYRCWRIKFQEERRNFQAARNIQRRYRGTLDRKVTRRLARKIWYVKKFIPAIIKVQTWTRMFCAYREYTELRRRRIAACRIQKSYRYSIARAEAMRRWEESMRRRKDLVVAQMQKIVRGFQARKFYRRLARTMNGRRISAAKTILKAWVNFRNSRRFTVLIEEHRIQTLSKKVVRLQAALQECTKDMEEINGDIMNSKKSIEKVKERIKKLTLFRIQSEIRIDNLKDNLKNITPEDFERGWAEAYDQEFTSLNQIMAMANNEMRCLQVKTNTLNGELLDLYLEKENCEIEQDELSMVEIETTESLRRAQVGRIERIITDYRNRLIRHERYRWRIASDRRNVLNRIREKAHGVLEKAKAKRNVDYATTITYEKRAKQWDYEKLMVEKFRKNDTKRLGASLIRSYEDYAGPVQDTYNNVVSNSLSLLRGWTMDEKGRMIREGTKKKGMGKKGRGQFAPLKDEFAEKRAFEYLEK